MLRPPSEAPRWTLIRLALFALALVLFVAHSSWGIPLLIAGIILQAWHTLQAYKAARKDRRRRTGDGDTPFS